MIRPIWSVSVRGRRQREVKSVTVSRLSPVFHLRFIPIPRGPANETVAVEGLQRTLRHLIVGGWIQTQKFLRLCGKFLSTDLRQLFDCFPRRHQARLKTAFVMIPSRQ